MRKFEFAFEVEGFDLDIDDQIQALYDASLDVTVSSTSGRVTMTFLVLADGASKALHNTLETLRKVLPEVQVLRMDRDLVAVSDIADRTDRSPESVRLLTLGRRGGGGFPSPVATLSGGLRVWEWASVLTWFQANQELIDEPDAVDRETAALFDAALVTGARTIDLRTYDQWHAAGNAWIISQFKHSFVGLVPRRAEFENALVLPDPGVFV